MQLRDYLAVIVKRWWAFLLVTAIAAGTAYGYSKVQQPIFRSSAKLYIMPARPDYGNVMFTQTVVRQYSQLILADRFLSALNDELRLDLPLPVLRSRISSSGTVDNMVIQIEVDDPSPGSAQNIAKLLAMKFVEDQELRMRDIEKANRIDVFMYDEPTPAFLSQPKTRTNVMAGAVLGFILGGLIAFVLEYLDDTIKSSQDVEHYVAVPVVGSIPIIRS